MVPTVVLGQLTNIVKIPFTFTMILNRSSSGDGVLMRSALGHHSLSRKMKVD